MSTQGDSPGAKDREAPRRPTPPPPGRAAKAANQGGKKTKVALKSQLPGFRGVSGALKTLVPTGEGS